jgi:hypothetical protein
VKTILLQSSKTYLTDTGDRAIMQEIPEKAVKLPEIQGLKPELFPERDLS